jgi:hydroxysqualene dehydroxylase
MRTAIVVGGGFAGVAAATALAEAGWCVNLMEARGHLGGRASSSAPSDMFPAPFDNSPHLLMGCYSETRTLMQRLGATKDIRWHDPLALWWLAPGGKRFSLRAWHLPSPFHLLAGLISSNAFPWREKRSLAGTLRKLLEDHLSADSVSLTVAGFLTAERQGSIAIERFWRPITRSVMNLDPMDAPLPLLANALKRIFSPVRFDSAMGILQKPLSDSLFPGVSSFLSSRGGKVFLNRPVKYFQKKIVGFKVLDFEGGELPCDALVWAVPPYLLAPILGVLSTVDDQLNEAQSIADPGDVGKMPIVCVHAILDREVLSGPFVGLAGARFDWVFNRNENWSWSSPAGQGQYLSFVASAAEDLASRKDGAILHLALEELRNRLGGINTEFQVRYTKVVREMAATPRFTQNALRLRASTRTQVPGFFLAGDWTDTGLPATIEGAVLSGHRAAQSALDLLGRAGR